ncbi:MAG: UDP-N-acetylglucosamine diphosphorylase [Chlamydiota bacterium]
MMDIFSGSYYFDLKYFQHQALFRESTYVWEALDQISVYLKNSALGDIEGEISKEAYLVNPELITIGKGSVVEPGAYIKGPCVIGKNCSVRHGAYIRSNVITGDGCVIGHATEVKNSIFLDGAKAGHFAYVGDSILGNEVNLGAGVKLANLRLDKKNIKIKAEEQKIDSNRKKLGSIIGDNSQLGCNTVANPGTFLGRGSLSYPCSTIKGLILKAQP